MTHSSAGALALTANSAFKSQYHRTLKWSLLVALLLTALMVWLSPRYEPAPYQLREPVMKLIHIETDIIIPEVPKVPPPLAMPNIEPAAEGEEDPEPFIPPIWDPTPRVIPPVVINDYDFVASSAKPQLVSQPKPHYPEVARLAQVEGTVIVKVLVGVDGRVKAAEIVQGAHTLLNNAALKAAQRCVFVPGQQRAMKVETWVAVPYRFRLH